MLLKHPVHGLRPLVLCTAGLFIAMALVTAAHARPPLPPEPPGSYGGYTGPGGAHGGYTGPGPTVVSVKEALQMEDGAWLALRGKITQSLGEREYLFTDASGSVELHIGPHEWQGQTVGPDDLLEIRGKMHREWMRCHIHVRRIIKQ